MYVCAYVYATPRSVKGSNGHIAYTTCTSHYHYSPLLRLKVCFFFAKIRIRIRIVDGVAAHHSNLCSHADTLLSTLTQTQSVYTRTVLITPPRSPARDKGSFLAHGNLRGKWPEKVSVSLPKAQGHLAVLNYLSSELYTTSSYYGPKQRVVVDCVTAAAAAAVCK